MRMGNAKQLDARRNHSFWNDSTAMEPSKQTKRGVAVR
jgi:hypothetical protein